jgi:hypothetical protein
VFRCGELVLSPGARKGPLVRWSLHSWLGQSPSSERSMWCLGQVPTRIEGRQRGSFLTPSRQAAWITFHDQPLTSGGT